MGKKQKHKSESNTSEKPAPWFFSQPSYKGKPLYETDKKFTAEDYLRIGASVGIVGGLIYYPYQIIKGIWLLGRKIKKHFSGKSHTGNTDKK